MRWHTVSPESLIWRELEGELVVRNAESGSTHLLEPLAGEVFRALVEAEAGVSVSELVARLRDDDRPEAEWTAAIAAVLAKFEQLGLAVGEAP